MKVRIQELDTPNKNGRIYRKDVMEKAIEETEQTLIGTIGMPEGGEIDIMKISHKVENLRIEDNFLVGDMTILGTPEGFKLSDMVECHDSYGFRLAGIGTVKRNEDGVQEVQPDYKIMSVCFTNDPA